MDEQITADEFTQREAGGAHDLAGGMLELEAAAEWAWLNFQEMPERVPAEWLAAVKLIAETELKLWDAPAYGAALKAGQ